MSSTTQKGPNDLETLHDAARRLLQELEKRVKRPSGERPERIEPEAKGWEEPSQTSGIRERCSERGFEIGGGPLDLGCNSFSFEASEDASGPDAGSIPSTDRGERERSLPYVFSEFDLRAVPRRAWLGGGDPLPRPSSRLLIANNDNRHVRALTRSFSSMSWTIS
jgi:hypothetical protein